MNIANVISRFLLLADIDNGEIYKWRSIIDDACTYVSSCVIKNKLNDTDNKRIEMLCAVYAFRLYTMCNDENITSFTAGDVTVASPDGRAQKAEKLWNEYKNKSYDLIDVDKFIFGRVM